MLLKLTSKPRLRPVEAQPVRHDGRMVIQLSDASRVSEFQLTVTEPVLFILSQLDGQTPLAAVGERFAERYRQSLGADTLLELVQKLNAAHLLDGPEFEEYYESLVRTYRAAAVRTTRAVPENGDGDLGAHLGDILGDAQSPCADGELVGLIAPHLDYPRGRPCYASAYAALAARKPPERVIILGTNHFGRSPTVVATASAFSTPLGTARTDVAFIERLERRCGDLRRFEYDHANEHSVELQVLWLQHLFGAESFQIVPVLCPDPCGPTGTGARDGQGAELRTFAEALREAIEEDAADTLVVAGADFSHVGAAFGDERQLDENFLGEVRRLDQALLDYIAAVEPEPLRARVAGRQNCTRVCSVGCIYALMTALPGTRASVLGYHQAVDQPTQTCVTCAAVTFHR